MNSTRIRNSVLAITAAGALGLAAACGGDSSGGSDGAKDLRVTMVPGVSSLPVKVAMEKGFFSERGLNIQLTEGLEVSAWQSAAGQQFDIVFTHSGVYTPSQARGLDNTLLNNTTNASDDYVSITLATKEKLNSLSELRGAKIGAPTLTGLTAESLKYLMAEEGVKPNEYEIVQMPYTSHPDNLKAGNIDAALTANPYYGVLEREGYVLWGKDLAVEAHRAVSGGKVTTASSSNYAAKTDWVNNNKETVNAWLDGVQAGADFIRDNEDESRTILKSWLNLTDELAADAVIPKYTLELDEPQFEASWNVLAANGVLQGEFPADRFKIYQR